MSNFGLIEPLFLFAPLVLVPLGLSLSARLLCPGVLSLTIRAVRFLQSFTAVLVTVSFFFPQGWFAGLLVAPWTLLAGLLGLAAVIAVARRESRTLADGCFAAGYLLLMIGAGALFASRLGAHPLGFFEPIVLLMAVHFHYAGFVAPIIAGAVGRAVENRTGWIRRLYCPIVAAIVVGSPLVALGFILNSPFLKLMAVFLLGLGLVGLSLLHVWLLPAIRPFKARVLLGISIVSIPISMVLAVLYALGEFYGTAWISIPTMAETHGALNAVGFSLCGLLGWFCVKREVL